MTETAPDEILGVILFHAITVPTKIFEEWRTPYTYAGTPRSTVPDILLVSKRWHAVGISWLYESAILRTRPQVDSFVNALQNSVTGASKPGRYLRRLRIEGGYDKLVKILTAAPGITTLFLGLNLTNQDTVPGLQRTMKKINPHRLLLDRLPDYSMQSMMNVLKAVGAGIPHWNNLKRLDVGPSFVFWNDLETPLKRAPSLEHVSLYNQYSRFGPLTSPDFNGGILGELSENPNVKVLQMRGGTNLLAWRRLQNLVPQKLFVGEEDQMFSILDFPDINVVTDYADRLPDLPDKIWHRIMGFATHEGGFDYLKMDEERFQGSNHPNIRLARRNLILVSKRFFHLALPHLYSIPLIRKSVHCTQLANRLRASKKAASFVRVLYIPPKYREPQDGTAAPMPIPSPLHIDAALPNLVHVDRNFNVFPHIAERCPDGELPLEWMEQEIARVVTPSDFVEFTHLRTIIFYGGRTDAGLAIPLDALPRLEILHLWNCEESLVTMFCAMRLVSLRDFGTYLSQAFISFLEVHGAKLQALAVCHPNPALSLLPDYAQPLVFCPNVVELCLKTAPSYQPRGFGIPPSAGVSLSDCIPIFPISVSHAKIKRLAFRPADDDTFNYHPDLNPVWSHLVDYVSQHRPLFPALEEVRIASLDWPNTEMAYCCSRAAEVAYDLRPLGIYLADLAGRRWERINPLPYRIQTRERLKESSVHLQL